MAIRTATSDEIASWDTLVAANPDGGEFLQMREFADIKQAHGWKPVYLMADDIALLVLEKRIPLLGRLWYIQRGPGIATANQLKKLSESLAPYAAKHGVFMVKCEPNLEDTEATRKALTTFMQRGADAQPTYSTVWVNIRDPLDTLEQSFNSKTRYNIRQARKGDITVKEMPTTDSTYETFYHLFTETATDRFVIRPYEYYRLFWDTYCQSGHGAIFFAYEQDQIVAADFVMINGTRASRKDAGSARSKSVRGAPALLVLETIRALQSRGVTDYDLCGAPRSEYAKDPNHSLYGIGTFKTGFSEHITDYVGTYTLNTRPLAARLWTKGIEKVVRRLYFMRHKQGWY